MKMIIKVVIVILKNNFIPLIQFNNWNSIKFVRINCYNLQLATTVFFVVGNTKFGTCGYIVRNRHTVTPKSGP